MKTRLQYLGLGVASAWPLAFSAPAWAANGTMTITGITGPTMGKVAAASNINGNPGGTTTFTIDPASGDISASPTLHGGQIGSSTAIITVTVKCANGTDCSNGGKGSITALASPLVGRALELQNFTVAKGAGNIVPTQTSATTTVTNFTLPSINKNTSKTFQVGLDFPIAGDQSASPSGAATAKFQIAVIAGTSGTPTGPMTGTASATVYRGISMSKTSDLVFGVIGKPTTGTGTVTMTSGGVLTTASGAMKLTKSGVTPSAASYGIIGEGSEGFTLTIPGSFSMSSGTNILVVTTSASAANGSKNFPGSAGTLQTFPIQVGGSFSVASGASTGAYTGTFTITAAYN